MSTDSPFASAGSADRQPNWQTLVGVGVLVAILGAVAILAPFVTGVTLSIVVGALLVVGGLGHVAHAFTAPGWSGSLWQVILALVYTFAGISLLANPILGLTTLTLLLVFYLAIEGVAEVVLGLSTRSEPQWGWFVASGVVSLVLAGLLWAGFPSTATWAVGLLVGLGLLSTGLAMVSVGYLGRQSSRSRVEEKFGEPRSG